MSNENEALTNAARAFLGKAARELARFIAMAERAIDSKTESEAEDPTETPGLAAWRLERQALVERFGPDVIQRNDRS